MNTIVRIKRIDPASHLSLPTYATEHSAGMDLLAANLEPVTIKAGEIKLIPAGFSIALPHGFEAQIRPRSGLALKHGITVLNSPGTIDADYRGEVKILLINHGNEDFIVETGTRVAQMVIARHEKIDFKEVDSLDSTERGQGGWGSTGY